ncbi:hypothetical protein EUGRSUZ_K03163 [Eucalyptus grandis]|uniref:Uncharacterized protein n=2 Tax=Eucalyptus grandis TaxID=71139 RepID=A0ACC3IYR4_EUCGR|nr:hypothetical protein EUGRSUZ_K03163 [Eucalyptus grandis]
MLVNVDGGKSWLDDFFWWTWSGAAPLPHGKAVGGGSAYPGRSSTDGRGRTFPSPWLRPSFVFSSTLFIRSIDRRASRIDPAPPYCFLV